VPTPRCLISFALAAISLAPAAATAQPVIDIAFENLTTAGLPDHKAKPGDTIAVTIQITGIDFDPFAPTRFPLPAPSLYKIDVGFSGGGTIDPTSFLNHQPRPIDIDFLGPLPAQSLFSSSTSADGLVATAADAALILGSRSPDGLFDDGPLFTFQFVIDDAHAGDIDVQILEPSAFRGELFSFDVLDYGSGINSTHGARAGIGNAILTSRTITVHPAPGAAGLLALTGLAAARRRR